MPKHIIAVHNYTTSAWFQGRDVYRSTSPTPITEAQDLQNRCAWISRCIQGIVVSQINDINDELRYSDIFEIVFPEFTCQPFTGAYRCGVPGGFDSVDSILIAFRRAVQNGILAGLRNNLALAGDFLGRITVILGSIVTIEPTSVDSASGQIQNFGIRNLTLGVSRSPPHLATRANSFSHFVVPKLRISDVDFIQAPSGVSPHARTPHAICTTLGQPIYIEDIDAQSNRLQLAFSLTRDGLVRKNHVDSRHRAMIQAQEVLTQEVLKRQRHPLMRTIEHKIFPKRHDARVQKYEIARRDFAESSVFEILRGRSFLSATSPATACIQDIRVCLDHARPFMGSGVSDIDEGFAGTASMDDVRHDFPVTSALIVPSAGMEINPARLARLAQGGVVVCVDGGEFDIPTAYRVTDPGVLQPIALADVTFWCRLSGAPESVCAAQPGQRAEPLNIYRVPPIPTNDIVSAAPIPPAMRFGATVDFRALRSGGAIRAPLGEFESRSESIVSGSNPAQPAAILCTAIGSVEEHAARARAARQPEIDAARVVRRRLSVGPSEETHCWRCRDELVPAETRIPNYERFGCYTCQNPRSQLGDIDS